MFVAVELTLLPGAWIALARARGALSITARLALAVTLSPAVVAAEYCAVRAVGVGFVRSAPLIALVNLPAALLIGRAVWTSKGRLAWHRLGAGFVVFACVAASVAIPWIGDRSFLMYSWHGLMHSDICQAIARGGLIPDEPELAGIRLAYPWFGHIYWALLSATLDIPPTALYPVTNLLWLLATGVLCSALASELGASFTMALAAPVLLALGTNAVGLAGWSVMLSNASGQWWAILGDLRYAPFASKFVTFEIMTFGIALFVAQALLSVVALRHRDAEALLLASITVLANAALYPSLLPAALLMLAALLAIWGIDWHRQTTAAAANQIWLAAGLGLLALVGSLGLTHLFTLSRVSAPLELSSPRAAAKKLVAATIALAPFAPLLWVAWRGESAAQRRPLCLLLLAAAGALALNIGVRIGDGLNEYKFFMCAGICIGPLACLGAERSCLQTNASQRATLVALLVLLAPVMVGYARFRTPKSTAAAPVADTGSFQLSLTRDSPHDAWTRTVREQTPAETVLVVYKPEFHVTSFTGRALFVPSEPDAPRSEHQGYNMRGEFHMVLLRGYDALEFAHRRATLEQVYAAEPTRPARQILSALMALHRPVAVLVEPRRGQPFLRWLREQRIGRELLNDTHGRVVYFIPANANQ